MVSVRRTHPGKQQPGSGSDPALPPLWVQTVDPWIIDLEERLLPAGEGSEVQAGGGRLHSNESRAGLETWSSHGGVEINR